MAKTPKTIGEIVDLMFQLRETRRELEAQVQAVKDQYAALEEHLRANFDKSKLDGAKGKQALAAIKRTTVADIKDWDAYFQYIAKTKSWDLLQRRPSVTALRLRWDEGKEVPGAESKIVESISLTKV